MIRNEGKMEPCLHNVILSLIGEIVLVKQSPIIRSKQARNSISANTAIARSHHGYFSPGKYTSSNDISATVRNIRKRR